MAKRKEIRTLRDSLLSAHPVKVEEVPPIRKGRSIIQEIINTKLKRRPGVVYVILDTTRERAAMCHSLVYRMNKWPGVTATARSGYKGRLRVFASWLPPEKKEKKE